MFIFAAPSVGGGSGDESTHANYQKRTPSQNTRAWGCLKFIAQV
jgi:hypothetical protein